MMYYYGWTGNDYLRLMTFLAIVHSISGIICVISENFTIHSVYEFSLCAVFVWIENIRHEELRFVFYRHVAHFLAIDALLLFTHVYTASSPLPHTHPLGAGRVATPSRHHAKVSKLQGIRLSL